MPKGPNGERRPADVTSNAVHLTQIATCEIKEDICKAPSRANGGRVRADRLTHGSALKLQARPRQLGGKRLDRLLVKVVEQVSLIMRICHCRHPEKA